MTTDFLLDDDGDLMMQGGDLVVGDSTAQHASLILESHPSAWRQWPLIGVGLSSFLLEDTNLAEIRHRMEVHVEYDGGILDSMDSAIEDDELTVTNLSIRYPDGT